MDLSKTDKLWEEIGICDARQMASYPGSCNCGNADRFAPTHSRYRLRIELDIRLKNSWLSKNILNVERLSLTKYRLNNLQIIELMDVYGVF